MCLDTLMASLFKFKSDDLTVDELSDSPSPGYLSDKHSHEGRPGDPPAPVEDCPIVHPVFGPVSFAVLVRPS